MDINKSRSTLGPSSRYQPQSYSLVLWVPVAGWLSRSPYTHTTLMRYSVLGSRSIWKSQLEWLDEEQHKENLLIWDFKSIILSDTLKQTQSLFRLTLQQECVGGSANINLLDVVICGYRVVTNDKPRDVAWCGNVGHCPCHPNMVSTHPSKLQVGGCWNCWKNEELKVIATTE